MRKPRKKTRLVPTFQNGYLLLQRLQWIDESETAYGIDLREGLPQYNADLHRFSSSGKIRGATSSLVQQMSPESEWRFKPREVLYPFPVNPIKPHMGLLPLGEIALSEMSDAKSEGLSAFRDDILKRVFVGQNTDYFYPQHFLSIVYLEPPQELLPVNASESDLLTLIKLFRDELHQSISVAVPQLFEDLVVFPGPLGPDIRHDLLVVRRGPLSRDGLPYSLPQSVLRLSNLISTVHQLDTGRRTVEENPLFQRSPTDYLLMLTKDIDKRRHRLSLGRDRKLAKAYEDHLTHRLDGIEAYKLVRSLVKDYKHASGTFENNALSSQDSWLWQTELVSNGTYRYGVISAHWSDLTEAGEQIEQAAVELEVRERAVSNYLRDYFNAEVARSNLAVQRAVHRLTIVAILVALIALLMQIPLATINDILKRILGQ
jgi:hypothetical protein